MSEPEPTGDLRDRLREALIATALRQAREKGIKLSTFTTATIHANAEALADAVLPIVQAERRRALADLDAGRVTAKELAAAGLDPGHVLDLRDDGWTLQHPLTCRPDLFGCPVGVAASAALAEPPGMTGRYPCHLDDDGRLVIGAAR